ncbi:MAG: PepSY domain-containing protein [Roseiflexaceae bacterium]|nr:PepSY domain-containing protein [Roseiflexaceae bacterium]
MSSIAQPETRTATDADVAGDAATLRAGHFYRVVWRWHFYAGLFVIPFLLILAVTGIVYLFKPQLDRLMYPQHVQASGAALPFARQIAAASAVYPGATISSVVTPEDATRSTEVTLAAADGRDLTVFVDPYTATVLGERNENNNLQYYAVTLHGELMAGTWGDYLVELAACWAIVLVVSGLFMWWPRKGSMVWGILLPRLNRTNKRIFWRDMHAVVGFWGSAVVLFLLLTGLPWAGFWGSNFAKVSSQYPAQLWDDVPASTQLTGDLNTTAVKTVPWAVEQLPMPTSTNSGVPAGTPVNLDSVVALAQAQGVASGFSVSLPDAAEGVYTVSIFPNDPGKQATLHIDQYSGAVLADVRFADYALVPKAVEMGIAVHEGKYFGPLNQIVMLLACLVVITLAFSAVVMWWQRRPAKRLGAPAMPKNFPIWKGAVALIAVLGIAFPFVGISLVVVLLLDYLVIQRVPMLKAALN